MRRTRRRLVVLVAYGPEARAFLQSGLLDGFDPEELCIAAWNPGSAALDGYAVVPAPRAPEPEVLQRIRGGCRRRSDRWPALAALERVAARALGGSAAWADLFRDLGAEALLAASYNSVRTLPALRTAMRLGLRTVVLTNSWKDAFAKPHAPVALDAFGLGSAAEVAAFGAANPELRDRAFVSGRPHLARLAAPGAAPSREAFCRRVGLDPARPFLCYTAAAPATATDEAADLVDLLDRLRRRTRPFELLLRLNPMGDDGHFDSLAGRPDVVIQRPEWEWEPDQEWCCPLPSDAELLAGAAEHAAANVSLPSTVTLEFAARGTPVINLCATPQGRERWDADSYAEARDAGWATPAFTPSLAAELALAALEERPVAPPVLWPQANLELARTLLTRVVVEGTSPPLRGREAAA